ncbi:MAG TPA: hypothetical protein VGF84_18155 [Micromonosporaceae bacterium]|jgi:hypothetical protein
MDEDHAYEKLATPQENRAHFTGSRFGQAALKRKVAGETADGAADPEPHV